MHSYTRMNIEEEIEYILRGSGKLYFITKALIKI